MNKCMCFFYLPVIQYIYIWIHVPQSCSLGVKLGSKASSTLETANKTRRFLDLMKSNWPHNMPAFLPWPSHLVHLSNYP